MKQTALALSHLVQTRFRHDALQIIGFNIAARRLTPVQLAEAEPHHRRLPLSGVHPQAEDDLLDRLDRHAEGSLCPSVLAQEL